jgi:hypothetical protein
MEFKDGDWNIFFKILVINNGRVKNYLFDFFYPYS